MYHILERLNFDIESAEVKSGFSGEGVIHVELPVSDPDASSFFSLESADETGKRPIFLILAEESHELTRVSIEDVKGEIDTSSEGAEFLRLLYRRLR